MTRRIIRTSPDGDPVRGAFISVRSPANEKRCRGFGIQHTIVDANRAVASGVRDVFGRFNRMSISIGLADPASRRIEAGQPYPLGATWDGNGRISRCFPHTRRGWTCACSTRRRALRREFRCRSTRTRCGTGMCPGWSRARSMDFGRTGRICRKKGIDSIRTSCCWIPTR